VAHFRVKAVVKDGQHLAIVREDVSDEPIDALRLGDTSELEQEQGAESDMVQLVGHLHGDFCLGSAGADKGCVTDYPPVGVEGDEPEVLRRVHGRSPVRRAAHVRGCAEETHHA
jgi:hypothetical protein